MKIVYINEYDDEVLVLAETNPALPFPGDSVTINDEEFIVKSRMLDPKHSIWYISVVDSMITRKKQDNDSGRLNEVKADIIAVSQRQRITEKRVRTVRDQASSMRNNINQSRFNERQE